MRTLSSHSKKILLAITATLSVMSTAGSPCCGSPTRTIQGKHALALADAGAFPGETANMLLPDGGVSSARCDAICGPSKDSTESFECELVPDAGNKEVQCIRVYDVCNQPSGRRPPRHRTRVVQASSEAGAYFAQLADLEAASVDAFEIVAGDLARFGAPKWMQNEAMRAARDERRHARTMSKLARARGGRVRRRSRTRTHVRDLFTFALENAVEGCVRETYGALLAWHQAIHARDADVRAAMQAIAHEETRHAAFARAMHAWTMKRLSARERAKIERAMDDAKTTLDLRMSPALRRDVGLPDRDLSRALFERL